MPAQILPSPPTFSPSSLSSHADSVNSLYMSQSSLGYANNVVPPQPMRSEFSDHPMHLRNGQVMVPSSATVPMMMNHGNPASSTPFVRAQALMTLPAPRMHKAWMIDCKACGTFLTNRGMKVSLWLLTSSIIIHHLFHFAANYSPSRDFLASRFWRVVCRDDDHETMIVSERLLEVSSAISPATPG